MRKAADGLKEARTYREMPKQSPTHNSIDSGPNPCETSQPHSGACTEKSRLEPYNLSLTMLVQRPSRTTLAVLPNTHAPVLVAPCLDPTARRSHPEASPATEERRGALQPARGMSARGASSSRPPCNWAPALTALDCEAGAAGAKPRSVARETLATHMLDRLRDRSRSSTDYASVAADAPACLDSRWLAQHTERYLVEVNRIVPRPHARAGMGNNGPKYRLCGVSQGAAIADRIGPATEDPKRLEQGAVATSEREHRLTWKPVTISVVPNIVSVKHDMRCPYSACKSNKPWKGQASAGRALNSRCWRHNVAKHNRNAPGSVYKLHLYEHRR